MARSERLHQGASANELTSLDDFEIGKVVGRKFKSQNVNTGKISERVNHFEISDIKVEDYPTIAPIFINIRGVRVKSTDHSQPVSSGRRAFTADQEWTNLANFNGPSIDELKIFVANPLVEVKPRNPRKVSKVDIFGEKIDPRRLKIQVNIGTDANPMWSVSEPIETQEDAEEAMRKVLGTSDDTLPDRNWRLLVKGVNPDFKNDPSAPIERTLNPTTESTRSPGRPKEGNGMQKRSEESEQDLLEAELRKVREEEAFIPSHGKTAYFNIELPYRLNRPHRTNMLFSAPIESGDIQMEKAQEIAMSHPDMDADTKEFLLEASTQRQTASALNKELDRITENIIGKDAELMAGVGDWEAFEEKYPDLYQAYLFTDWVEDTSDRERQFADEEKYLVDKDVPKDWREKMYAIGHHRHLDDAKDAIIEGKQVLREISDRADELRSPGRPDGVGLYTVEYMFKPRSTVYKSTFPTLDDAKLFLTENAWKQGFPRGDDKKGAGHIKKDGKVIAKFDRSGFDLLDAPTASPGRPDSEVIRVGIGEKIPQPEWIPMTEEEAEDFKRRKGKSTVAEKEMEERRRQADAHLSSPGRPQEYSDLTGEPKRTENPTVLEGQAGFALGSSRDMNPYEKALKEMSGEEPYDDERHAFLKKLSLQWDTGYHMAEAEDRRQADAHLSSPGRADLEDGGIYQKWLADKEEEVEALRGKSPSEQYEALYESVAELHGSSIDYTTKIDDPRIRRMRQLVLENPDDFDPSHAKAFKLTRWDLWQHDEDSPDRLSSPGRSAHLGVYLKQIADMKEEIEALRGKSPSEQYEALYESVAGLYGSSIDYTTKRHDPRIQRMRQLVLENPDDEYFDASHDKAFNISREDSPDRLSSPGRADMERESPFLKWIDEKKDEIEALKGKSPMEQYEWLYNEVTDGGSRTVDYRTNLNDPRIGRMKLIVLENPDDFGPLYGKAFGIGEKYFTDFPAHRYEKTWGKTRNRPPEVPVFRLLTPDIWKTMKDIGKQANRVKADVFTADLEKVKDDDLPKYLTARADMFFESLRDTIEKNASAGPVREHGAIVVEAFNRLNAKDYQKNKAKQKRQYKALDQVDLTMGVIEELLRKDDENLKGWTPPPTGLGGKWYEVTGPSALALSTPADAHVKFEPSGKHLKPNYPSTTTRKPTAPRTPIGSDGYRKIQQGQAPLTRGTRRGAVQSYRDTSTGTTFTRRGRGGMPKSKRFTKA